MKRLQSVSYRHSVAVALLALQVVAPALAQSALDSPYFSRGADVTSVPAAGQPGAEYFSNGAQMTRVPTTGPAAAFFSNGAGALTAKPSTGPNAPTDGVDSFARYFSDGAQMTSVPRANQPGADYFSNGARATSVPPPGQPGADYFSNGARATSVPARGQPGAEYFTEGANPEREVLSAVRRAAAAEAAREDARAANEAAQAAKKPAPEAPTATPTGSAAAEPALPSSPADPPATPGDGQPTPPPHTGDTLDESESDAPADQPDDESASAAPAETRNSALLVSTAPREARVVSRSVSPEPAAELEDVQIDAPSTFEKVIDVFAFGVLGYTALMVLLLAALAIGVAWRIRTLRARRARHGA